MFVGMGLIEILIFVFFGLGGSVGVPMGMSPAPEDPMMAAIAPDECLAWSTWSGSIVPPVDGNITERWMAQPELGDAWKNIQTAYFEYCRRGADAENEAILESAATVTRHFIMHAVAFYVTETTVTDFGPFEELTGGALVELGEDPDEVMGHINAIVKFMLEEAEQQPETIAIDGRTFRTMMVPNAVENRFTWGPVDEHHFAVTIGEGEMERLLARMKTPPPAWLIALKERLPVDRVSSVSWIDGKKLVDLIMEAARQSGVEEPVEILEILGLSQIRGIGQVTGLDEKGFVGRSHVRIEGEPSGLQGLFSETPITAVMISRVPDDRMFTLALAVSPSRIFELIQKTVETNEFMRGGFESSLNEFNESAGLDLKSDIIERLDENAFFYGSINLANPSSGWVVGVGASKEMGLSDPFMKIVQLLRDNSGEAYKITESEVDGITIYTYEDQRGWSGVNGASWALGDGELLFSLDKSSMRRHLRREPLANDALANNEWFAQVFTSPSQSSSGPIMISSLDLPQVLRLAIPLASPFVDQMLPDGFDYSMDDIPSLDVLTKEMKPNLTAMYRTSDGFESVQRQTYPGGSPINLIPAVTVSTLPAMMEVARSANRTDPANRVRQLVIAMHNYHDANKALPARFNKNDAGEPLLSWRVHILPFMGYQDLYNRFNLNEPWDSEHNKTLIDQMPSDFAHPKMKLDPGKTVYVVPQGADSVMIDPGDARTSPKGTRLEAVTDGTSRTALVLEVAGENAVIWTQPSDYAWEDHIPPVTGLYSGWRNGLIIGFCDGSVQTLSPDKVTEVFEAIVKANDGEVIDLWDDR